MSSKTIKISIVLLCLFSLAIPLNVGSAAGEIPPLASAPECADTNSDGHADVTDNKDYGKSPDKELYHDLWNEIKGCHYNHEHGDDPNAPEIVAIFGPAGDVWNGATDANIGVPFATSSLENTMKHPMSIYYTMTAAQLDAAGFPCGVRNDTDNGGNGTAHCVRGWRILAHGNGSMMEALANNHSFFAEIKLCNKNDVNQCGIIRSGGWFFFGKFQSPFYNQVFERPGGTVKFPGGMSMTFKSDAEDLAAINSPNTVFQDWGGEPYWFMVPKTADTVRRTSKSQYANGDQWSSNEVGPSTLPDCAPFPKGAQCGNRLIHLAMRTFDSWNLADTSNINNPYFICSQVSPANCDYNSSFRGMKEVQAWIDPAWDGASFDTDPRAGYVSMNQYTDRYQRLRMDGACSAIGLDCVPVILQNVPVGYAAVKTNPGKINTGIDREYDTYFNGKPSGWIQFPSHASQSPASTPTSPASTPTSPTSTPTSPASTPSSSSPFVSADVNPTSLNIDGTSLVSVNLNNVPADGYKSAEFTCTYNAGLVEKSNIIATNLFGTDPVIAIHDPQNGMFIVAIAGTDSNRATMSGPALTFSAKGLQAGQSQIQCTVRVSKGDNVPIDLPSTGASFTILGVEPSSPTPLDAPTLTPGDHQHPTATNTPFESLTPIAVPTLSPNGSLSGQVIASKLVTVSLFDANNVVITSMVANPDGTFSLMPLAGNYTLVATASGFLSHQGSVTITAGNMIVLPANSLLAGDVDGNNVIDQFDALTIGMSYTSSLPAAADLNNDGSIDFLDLELLAENYRKIGPSIW